MLFLISIYSSVKNNPFIKKKEWMKKVNNKILNEKTNKHASYLIKNTAKVLLDLKTLQN